MIKENKVIELQSFLSKNVINTISSSFQRVQRMSIPIIIYSIIQNAKDCFKLLLINDNDPRRTMQEQNPHGPQKYEWDCMATAIFYGRAEIITLLQEKGIEKGENPSHIEAAVLSFRYSIIKEIIKKNDNANISKIDAVKLFNLIQKIEKGVDINAKDIIYQINMIFF